MSQARWLTIALIALVGGTSGLFRLAHPVDAAVFDANCSLRWGRLDPVTQNIDELARAIDSRPGASLDLAWKLAARDRRAAAARLLTWAWDAHPFDRSLPEALVATYLGEANLDAAGAVFADMDRRGLALSPAGQKMRASLLVQSGKLAEAEETLRRMVAEDPTDVEALVQLGHVYDSQQRFSEAAATFRRVVTIRPNDGEAQLRLAQALSWAAMQDARRAIKITPVAARD